ncbi:hypothetical protein AVEN_170037-1 [Araneus ventricosus]|uniref:TIL domain-containing protein n=1 Tax=Araneus ventricosus TaxID=182803 RepID=A0A4Y2PM64_ARAVE|nr:hypothetical protein AVEN_170037-1 [Araneus ventricosus]
MKSLVVWAVAFALLACINAQCPRGEHFECGTACPETCQSIRGPPRACILACRNGCFCNRGLVRASAGRRARCIRRNQCRR